MKKVKRPVGEDFFETPEDAILPIKNFIPSGVKTILEPTYGKGAIGKVLEKWGYKVIKRDKYPKTDDTVQSDFLIDDIPECDCIIFNPPFSFKTQFMQRACESGKPFLFLCPLTVLETKTRYELMKQYGLSVLNLTSRTNFIADKKVWFHSVWIVRHPEFQNTILYA